MPNYKVTEYDTVISTYRIVAINKQDAINKIANGDIITRAAYRSNGFKKQEDKKKYRAREIINGKAKAEIQVIGGETQNQTTTTSTLLQSPTRTRTTEIYKIL